MVKTVFFLNITTLSWKEINVEDKNRLGIK